MGKSYSYITFCTLELPWTKVMCTTVKLHWQYIFLFSHIYIKSAKIHQYTNNHPGVDLAVSHTLQTKCKVHISDQSSGWEVASHPHWSGLADKILEWIKCSEGSSLTLSLVSVHPFHYMRKCIYKLMTPITNFQSNRLSVTFAFLVG